MSLFQSFYNELDRRLVYGALSLNTVTAYKETLRWYSKFIETNEPSQDTADRFITSLSGRKPVSVRRHLAALRQFHDFIEHPVKFAKTRRLTRRLPIVLTASEVENVLEADIPTWLHILVCLLYYGGLRIGEALSLRKRDIRDSTVRVMGKGGKERVVPLLGGVEYLHGYVNRISTDYLFSSPRNPEKPRTRQSVAYHLRRQGLALHLPGLSCHKFRHSCATELVRRRVDISYIAEFLGHATLDTTRIYTHVDSSMLSEALPRLDDT